MIASVNDEAKVINVFSPSPVTATQHDAHTYSANNGISGIVGPKSVIDDWVEQRTTKGSNDA